MNPKPTKLLWLLLSLATVVPVAAHVSESSQPFKKVTHQQQLRGQIVDTEGNPVVGATVTNGRTKQSVQTDAAGFFMLPASVGDTLSFRYVGFNPLDQQVTSLNSLTVVLTPQAQEIDEVMVSIGYQRVRKSDVTGAISSVKAEELNLTSPKLSQALVGKVAGVQIMQTSGAPYDGTKIRVRGMGSINAGSDPLYVIDGYPAGNNLNINPNDIETIDVLKDAASAAIYGSRAAGGVVLITTKRGKEGRSNVDYEVLS